MPLELMGGNILIMILKYRSRNFRLLSYFHQPALNVEYNYNFKQDNIKKAYRDKHLKKLDSKNKHLFFHHVFLFCYYFFIYLSKEHPYLETIRIEIASKIRIRVLHFLNPIKSFSCIDWPDCGYSKIINLININLKT